MREFLELISADEARAYATRFDPVGEERVAIEKALGRVLAQPIDAPLDMPTWHRSTMDGYAVRAEDTGRAEPDTPVRLELLGHVPMGDIWPGTISAGQAVAISTGGVLPAGADAVVMVEHVTLQASKILVGTAVRRWENVVQAGEDFRRGALLFNAGVRLRPQDVGAVAGLGMTLVPVRKHVHVGVLSSGSELVPPSTTPRPGQVRDTNQLTLAAQIERAGGAAVMAGIVGDSLEAISARVRDLVRSNDMVLISGGSSVGTRDLTARVFAELGGDVLYHGLKVRPGKPTILAVIDGKPVLGLPGVPVSAMVIFDMFVRPLLWRLAGEPEREGWPIRTRARLLEGVPSARGREDYVRVRFRRRDGELWAEPLSMLSAISSSVIFADGLVVIPSQDESIPEGELAEVLVYER